MKSRKRHQFKRCLVASSVSLILAEASFADAPESADDLSRANVAATSTQTQVAQALPQAAPGESPSEERASDQVTLTEVVVTGSRITRRDYVSPSPIVTTSVAAIEDSGAVNIDDALKQLPQFTPGQGATTNVLGGGGRATLNLRGLGEQRNLVLLDGRRLPASDALGVVDVNIIPTALLQSIEVISGGASAVYGSDAISGVANFKTLQRFEGLQFDVQYGNAFAGDAETFSASITGGGSFADGRGDAVFVLSTSERDELMGGQRSFYRVPTTGSTTMMGHAVLAGNLPTQAAVNALFAGYGFAPGTVLRTTNLGFNDDGTLFGSTGGANLQPALPEVQLMNGVVSQPVLRYNTIVSPQKRYNVFGRFNYEIAPSVTAYAQMLYANTEQRMTTNFPQTIPGLPSIPVTNPFIPDDLRALLASRPNPDAPFSISRRLVETGLRYYNEPFETFQIITGLKGALPWLDARWDVYASHDETRNPETLLSGVSRSRMATLLNAPDGGASICEGGYNPFGYSNAVSISDSCRNYLSLQIHNDTQVSQDLVEASLQGTLFALPAGDVQFSFTTGYRENNYNYSPDSRYVATRDAPNSDIYAISPTNFQDGSTSVTEYAGELLVPVLADVRMAESLNVSLGYRYSDYEISGGVSTYKLETDWRINSSLMVRAGYEHAIRAPNIAELFSAPIGVLANVGTPPLSGDPCDFLFSQRSGPNAAAIRNLCVQQGVSETLIDSFTFRNAQLTTTVSGNTQLDPEVADTFTAGLVWSPQFDTPLLSHLTVSADYYNITLEGAISPIAGGVALNKCFNLDGSNPTYSNTSEYCRLLTRDSTTGLIDSVNTPYLNLGGYKTSGVDLQLDWRLDLDAMDFGTGTVLISSVLNYLEEFSVQTLQGQPFQDFAGTIGTTPLPTWKALTAVSYRLGPVDVGVRWRHLGDMRDATSVTRPASPSPGVSAYDLFDLTGRWAVNDTVELRGGITNLADKAPLIVRGLPGTTDPALYDVIGRSAYLALRMKF